MRAFDRWLRFGGAAGAVLCLAALAGCGASPDAVCASGDAEQKLVEAVRAQYPNKASEELFARGSAQTLERILKEQNLDRNKYEDLAKAAALGAEELKRVYQEGRFTLEAASAIDKKDGDPTIRCSGRMVFYTRWGIVVKNVLYDVTSGKAPKLELVSIQ